MNRVVVAVLLLAAPSLAAAQQTEWHLYGGGGVTGGVAGGEEHPFRRGAFVGVGANVGGGAGAVGQRAPARGVYFSVDVHGLWLDETAKAELQRRSDLTGADLTREAIGLDFSLGRGVRSSTGRVSVIPVGLIGFTGTMLTTCVRGSSSCDEETETEKVNYGAGVVVAVSRLHAGFRYTRNYGAALSVGYIF